MTTSDSLAIMNFYRGASLRKENEALLIQLIKDPIVYTISHKKCHLHHHLSKIAPTELNRI
jgi:hypothetical protein